MNDLQFHTVGREDLMARRRADDAELVDNFEHLVQHHTLKINFNDKYLENFNMIAPRKRQKWSWRIFFVNLRARSGGRVQESDNLIQNQDIGRRDI